MKTLYDRLSEQDQELIPDLLKEKLTSCFWINELTIKDYVWLRIIFSEIADNHHVGDIYGFCEFIFNINK